MEPMQSAEREAAFHALFQRHYKDMRRYAVAVLRSHTGAADIDRAEEAVQETFLIAWKKFSVLLAHPSPVGWLYETLNFTLRNLMRADQRWALRILAVQESIERDAVAPPPGADLELEGLVSPEELHILKRLYVQGEPYETIYTELGISKTAFAKRVHRIKEKFRANYEKSEKIFSQDREPLPASGHDKKGGTKT